MTLAPGLTLVLGGARSGKSRYAEGLVEAAKLAGVYVATARDFGGDTEMAERIRHHRERRGASWRTVEAPLELGEAIRAEAAPGRAVLVDCLTLWLTNLMLESHDVEAESASFAALFSEPPAGPVILVSNEVGLGIVPDNRMARDFRDHAGRLHQTLAAKAERVVFVAAGLPLVLKG
ncbi:bifunctional adenosylcobinamide kinase/adenosylcobinamide-phosphate guanylyltransferase [Aureimonas leprariae]|uniref:Bifunctional adenosylcobalamin biosynthesis protein n=1 Tax=Plantimonas leprariae TaxID=2615207 RepID=A0A7V7PP13_9HYPH|nr:bifunctional adenosylcobinamide kinase/adenosylcobinamide-phosphate guanylyltransferase [Aureimonas leprariae]KAB0679651.1 bifunctional adenosylcobinamide kinase/adenosylcobinamide-phosphate guanylyltransferase [Aureimonas leprariae]